MLFRFTLATSILCLAAVLSGCGGSSTNSESSTEKGAPSLSRFVGEADRLCEQLQRRYQPEKEKVAADLEAASEVAVDLEAPSTGRELKHVYSEMRRLGDKLEECAARLRTMKVPQSERRLFGSMVAAKASQGRVLRSQASAFESLRLAKARAVGAKVAAKQKLFGRFAENIGLRQCGAES